MRKGIYFILFVVSILFVSMPAVAEEDNANFANVVVFVEFSDTNHDHKLEYHCSKNTKLAFEWFDGDGRYGSASNARSLKRYMDRISYGNVRIANYFPQFDGTEIIPFQLSNDTKYYSEHEAQMVGEIIGKLADYKGINLDLWKSDGCLDNLAIVVPYLGQDGSAGFTAHRAVYGSASDKISGSFVRSYTILPEESVYIGMGETGIIIHEFLHTLDYPDLYRSRGGENQPVGAWDIMATAGARAQYPLAYLRSHISGWFSIPTVTQSTANYSLYAATTATAATKDNQAVILKTDYSDTEFFVLEFRKKGEYYNNLGYYTNDLECGLPGSGLIIYRVNIVQNTNVAGPPDMIYLFGPGDDYGSDGYEQGRRDRLSESFLSAESGRTSYGSSDSNKSLADGAITYSDGTNSGIVISNVGSAEGDTITFDITFADSDDYWITVSEEQDNGDTSTEIVSYMDTDGTLYYLQKKDNNNRVYLYSYNSGWNRLGEVPGGWYHKLVKFNGSLYTAYLDSNFYVRLARWNGSGWENVSVGTYQANEISAVSGRNAIYISWSGSDKVYACEYTGSRVSMLGTMVGNENGVNPVIAEENGRIAVTYRLWMQDNKLCTKWYDRATNTWKDISGSGNKGNGIIKINGSKIYLLESGSALNVYTYDLEKDNGIWEKLGNSISLNGSSIEMDICFQGEYPYIVYMEGSRSEYRTNVMYVDKGRWCQLGSQVASGYIQGIHIYSKDSSIWVTYCGLDSSKKVYIKTHSSARIPDPTYTPKPVLPDRWPFDDVPVIEGHWRYESVKYVYENAVMNGITNSDGTINTFKPDEPLTRAMFATVLYRIEGNPPVSFESRFSDVSPGRYYSDAITWAYQNGIVNGYADGRFGINDNITREQIAKMLKYYADIKGYTADMADLSSFPDAAEVSGWAAEPIRWAVGNGMITGKNVGGTYYLDPKGEATRVECAAMLTRFMKRYR